MTSAHPSLIMTVSTLCLVHSGVFDFVTSVSLHVAIFDPALEYNSKVIPLIPVVAILIALAAVFHLRHYIIRYLLFCKIDKTSNLISIGEETADRKLRKWHM